VGVQSGLGGPLRGPGLEEALGGALVYAVLTTAGRDGRMISRWGCPHLGHFSSRSTCPDSSSLTMSPNRRLHPRQRSWCCAGGATTNPPWSGCYQGNYVEWKDLTPH